MATANAGYNTWMLVVTNLMVRMMVHHGIDSAIHHYTINYHYILCEQTPIIKYICPSEVCNREDMQLAGFLETAHHMRHLVRDARTIDWQILWSIMFIHTISHNMIYS